MKNRISQAALTGLVVLFGAVAAWSEEIGLGPYPSLEQVNAEIQKIEADFPGRAQVVTFGQSAGGRPLYCLRISRGDGKLRAEALVAGNIHGDEPIGNRTALALAHFLVEKDGQDQTVTKLLEVSEVYIIPLLNPDGYAETYQSQGQAPVKERRTNGRQVDLNRNFPRPGFGVWLPFGYSGSKNPKSTRYNGPASLSEPESQAVRELAAAHRFFADVDFHSAQGMIIPAKCKSRDCFRKHQAFAKAYQGGQQDPYSIFNRPPWFPVYQGNMEDFLLDESGALSLLIELGNRKERPGREETGFWKMNPRNPEPIIQNNLAATLAAILKAYDLTQGKPICACKR